MRRQCRGGALPCPCTILYAFAFVRISGARYSESQTGGAEPRPYKLSCDTLDVRRIDMAIGEKAYWGKGIGSEFIPMLVDFAFTSENVDVLHCFCEDYNVRSRRMWEKCGFTLVLSEELPQPQKGKLQLHFRLTKEEVQRAHT